MKPSVILSSIRGKMIKKVRKRTAKIEAFDSGKIQSAIEKAMRVVSELNIGDSRRLTDEIVSEINAREGSFYQGIPHIEEIQDIVEEVLSKSKLERTAKAYMLYRRARTHARELKKFFGIRDDLKFDINAIRVLQERYLLKDEHGRIIETPTEMFERVAKSVSLSEGNNKKAWEKRFFEMMRNLEFLPNSPTLMNAGTKLGQLSACFVLPVEDDLGKIFDSLKYMAMIQQSGGGTGFSFSHLRPRGEIVRSTKGIASGPVSFMRIFDAATEVIRQGGKRRGANMGILNVNHPDIPEFITSKQKEKQLSNFNISVGVNDEFLRAAENNEEYGLINPRTGRVARKINARAVFDAICESAWMTGDPGLIFLDEINRKNQLPDLGKLEATNPCGEVPLFPYESCNLGSINLTKIVENAKIDWSKLKKIVHDSVRFLDDVIEVNKYPFIELERAARNNRRIGLGVMGFADMLIMLGIPYDSKEAVKTAEELMAFVNKEAHNASQALGKEKGNFPNFEKSIWAGNTKSMRNCACTTIAPTGTISIIAGCSSGIEPLFALAYVREVLSGKHLFETNKVLEKTLLKEGIYSEKLIDSIAKTGDLKNSRVPEKIKKLFKTALEIDYKQHIAIQAGFQKHTDNAVSKTINLDNRTTGNDVKKAYLLAHKLGCKGITVYRYGSKKEQVLYLGEGRKYSRASSEYAGGTCIGKVCTL
ncbi:MAG: adenosylcobalamin-dependent ribonucleoside-diphosphate reductase [archaeon]|jgi:ribonucleoside-diphosphate reductase alpha chain|nr:adenosylcobalamin-dependent ribonucleoside-diphosphate reductase [archaeon]